jgi:hypothetical protein
MLDSLAFLAGVGLTLIGWYLVSNGISQTGFAQPSSFVAGIPLFGGAFLLSLGVLTVALTAKRWWHWRRELKEMYRPGTTAPHVGTHPGPK